MHYVDILEYFSKGIRPKDIAYTQYKTVSIPNGFPASVDVVEEDGSKHEEILPLVVIGVETPDKITEAYRAEREKRKSPAFRFPNDLLANLNYFHADGGKLYWAENMSDFSVLNGIMKSCILAGYDEAEQERIMRRLSPTAPMGLIESSDGYLVLGRRGGSVPAAGKIMPFPVGHPRFNREKLSVEDPLMSLSRQSVTELSYALYCNDVRTVFGPKDVYVIGATRGKNREAGSWVPVIPFVVEAKDDIKRLEEGYATAVDKYENERFVRLPIDKKSFSDFIVSNYGQLVDTGLGSLLLHGRFRFSESWYESMCQKLAEDFGAVIKTYNPFSPEWDRTA